MPKIDAVDNLVRECILNYFEGKSYSFGGLIPKNVLLNEKNIQTAKKDFCESLDHVYDKLKKYYPLSTKPGKLEWEVQYVLDIIKECRRLRIPKEFHGGMVILHMIYCKGFREIPSYNEYVVA